MANLYKLLGMRPEDGVISPSTSLIELGIDSLVAVDMRIWFTRELDLDLPVLKLLGGATVEDMVEDAVARLSPALIPNVKDGPKPEAEPAADAENQEESLEKEENGDAESSHGSSGGDTDELLLSGSASTVITVPQSEASDDEKPTDA